MIDFDVEPSKAGLLESVQDSSVALPLSFQVNFEEELSDVCERSVAEHGFERVPLAPLHVDLQHVDRLLQK